MARSLSTPLLMLARLAGAGAGFLTQLVLARLLSTEDLGLFFAATSFGALAGLVTTQGYAGVTQRFITRYTQRRREVLLHGFVDQVSRETLFITVAVIMLLVAVGMFWPGLTHDMRLVLVATTLLVGAASAFTIYAAFASVQRRFALALLPETIIRPVLFLPIVLIWGLVNIRLSAGIVVTLYGVLTALLALGQYLRVKSNVPTGQKVSRPRLTSHWRREAWLFALSVLFATSFADLAILLSSPFLGATGLAPFGVALKVSLLIGFAVQIAQQVALPDLAEAHERGDARGLSRALLHATLFPTFVTGAALIGAAVLGEWLLSLFGAQYTVATWPLLILTGAQLLRAVAGPGQSLLMLKGAQTTNAIICLLCTLMLALTNAILVPLFGLEGAAWAVAFTIVFWIGSCGYVLRTRYGIRVDLPFLVQSRLGL